MTNTNITSHNTSTVDEDVSTVLFVDAMLNYLGPSYSVTQLVTFIEEEQYDTDAIKMDAGEDQAQSNIAANVEDEKLLKKMWHFITTNERMSFHRIKIKYKLFFCAIFYWNE